MTNEKAIEIIKSECYVFNPLNFDRSTMINTALDTVIKELNTYREFADWLVKAVLEDDWEESADFYAEVLCRKLTKLGKLKVVDNKYMEVNADDSN